MDATTPAREARLKDGTLVTIRPIRPDDRDRLLESFERLSRESRYRRFLTPKERLSEAELTFLTHVDHHAHEALVAVDRKTGQGLGVARYVRLDEQPDAAEVAVTVVDDWQSRGLGTLLLEALANRARAEGIGRFVAVVHGSNRRMVDLLEQLGAARRSRQSEAGVVEFEVDLPVAEGIGPELARAMRAAAAGYLDVIFPMPSGLGWRDRRRNQRAYDRARARERTLKPR